MADLEHLIYLYDKIVLDGVVTRKRTMKTYEIHVFIGGESSNQIIPFKDAVYQCAFPPDRVHIHYLSTKEVKLRQWTARQFVSWLLKSDVHFILSHVHQGLSQLEWKMTTLQRELNRLCFHPGFPSGLQLKCPVFLQDKFRYLKSLPSLTNATLKIPLLMSYDYTEWPQTIASWCAENHEDIGWVLKVPYTTNSDFVRFPKTMFDVMRYLGDASNKYGETVSYVMLQPCMANRREYKAVLFNGEYSHIAENRLKYGQAFSKAPHKRIQEFVENATRELKRVDKSFVCDGLVRVDVFQDKDGVLRVNEFESLEANYYSCSHSKVEVEFAVQQKMSEYWMSLLRKHVDYL